MLQSKLEKNNGYWKGGCFEVNESVWCQSWRCICVDWIKYARGRNLYFHILFHDFYFIDVTDSIYF